MKKNIFIAAVIVAIAGITTQVKAQEVMGSQKTATKGVSSTSQASNGQTVVCTGKIRCTDGACTIEFDQEIVSPRDAASGLPTGKRMHKPFTITKELDQSFPAAVRESPTKASTGKVSVSDLSIMVTVKGKSTKLPVVNDQFTLPGDCCDNDCDLMVSWSWGESQSGSKSTGTADSGISKRYQATFNLAMKDGVYVPSKYTKTGHVTLMK